VAGPLAYRAAMPSEREARSRRSGGSQRAVSYDEVVERAIHLFVREGTLRTIDLVAALAISRATLYRVISDQDRLLGDMLWVLSARTLAAAERAAEGTGVDRMMDISRRFQAMVREFQPLRRFTETEAERAFRVLFTAAGGTHARTVGTWTRLFRDAEAAGEIALPFDAGQFAEMFVRLGETMVWSDLVGARAVDLALWEHVQRSLFTLAPDDQPRPSL
jgi:hypothetical protein